jgi:hypothetical protein
MLAEEVIIGLFTKREEMIGEQIENLPEGPRKDSLKKKVEEMSKRRKDAGL